MAKIRFSGSGEWPELAGLEIRLPEEGDILVDMDVVLARMTPEHKNGHEVLIKDVLIALGGRDSQRARSFMERDPELRFCEVTVLPKDKCKIIF